MGAGINLFRQLFPEDYYAYQTATLISSKPTSKVIKDSNDETIATYPLGGDELRGLLKVENGQLVAYGDVKGSDGIIYRYFEERAYASGDESLPNAITDGTNTVVELTTPTTASGTPFTNPMLCGSTEEFTDTRTIKMPCGHDTDYYWYNDKEKLKSLPDSAISNGNYIVSQTNGQMSLTSAATVATTGSYDDLTDKPTIPAAQVNSDWNSTSGVSQILNKPWVPVYTESEGVYQLRQTPITANRTLEKLIGVSCAFNQLVQNGNFADSTGWQYDGTSISVSNNVLTLNGDSTYCNIFRSFTPTLNHVYLLSGTITLDSAKTVELYIGSTQRETAFNATVNANTKTICSGIVKVTSTLPNYIQFGVQSGANNVVGQFENIQVIDLTVCFGSEVADYLYNLENG